MRRMKREKSKVPSLIKLVFLFCHVIFTHTMKCQNSDLFFFQTNFFIMTIQVRSKRRVLPKRSIIDVDFVSPTTHNLQDLLCTVTQIPSKQDYNVINELFGKSNSTAKQQLPPIVIGQSTRSRLAKKREQVDIPVEKSRINDEEMPSESTVEDGVENKLIENGDDNNSSIQSNDSSDDHDNSDGKDSTDDNDSIHSIENKNDINKSRNDMTQSKYNSEIEHSKDALTNIRNSMDSTTKEEMCLDHLAKDTETSSSGTVDEGDLIISKNSKQRPTTSPTKKRKKKRACEKRETSFMMPPCKIPKKTRTHATLKILKQSGALDWVVNGRDLDPRKKDIGKVRKRQLRCRLHRPFITKRVIHNKHAWLIKN